MGCRLNTIEKNTIVLPRTHFITTFPPFCPNFSVCLIIGAHFCPIFFQFFCAFLPNFCSLWSNFFSSFSHFWPKPIKSPFCYETNFMYQFYVPIFIQIFQYRIPSLECFTIQKVQAIS